MTKTTSKGISRRSLLKTGAAAVGFAAGSGAITGFPTIWAQNPITLRQFGTGVSNINAIAEKCKEDLGITLEMTATDSDAAAQRAVIQPMEVAKLKHYDSIVPLFKTGKLTPESTIAQGTAPHTVGYVDSADAKT